MACVKITKSYLPPIVKGATYRHRKTWLNPNKLPVDLTGCTGILEIFSGGTVLLTLSTSNGGMTLGGTTGTIDLFIGKTDTAAITWSTGEYKCLITFPGGESGGDARRVFYGDICVE